MRKINIIAIVMMSPLILIILALLGISIYNTWNTDPYYVITWTLVGLFVGGISLLWLENG